MKCWRFGISYISLINRKTQVSIDVVRVKRTLIGVGANMLLRLASVFLGFVLNLMLIRLWGVDSAGVYFFLLSSVLIVSTIFRGGYDGVVLRGGRDAYLDALGYLSDKRKWVLLGLCLIGAVMAALKQNVAFLTNAVFFAISASLLSVLNLRSNFLVFMGRPNWAVAQLSLIPSVVCVIGLVALSIADANVVGSYSRYFISIIYAISLYAALWVTPIKNSSNIPYSKKYYSSDLHVSSILSLLPIWAPTILVGLFYSSQEVSYINTVVRISSLLTFISISCNAIFSSKINALVCSGNNGAALNLAVISGFVSAGLAFPFLVVGVVYSQEFLLFFADEFSSGSLGLVVLLISGFLCTVIGWSAQLLIQMKAERIYNRISKIFVPLMLSSLGVTGLLCSIEIFIFVIAFFNVSYWVSLAVFCHGEIRRQSE